MAIMTEYSAAGAAQTDEVVACTEAYVVGATTYYRGFLANSCNENISGSDSATYGVWTAAAKAGSRKTVLLAGYPPDANSVVIDPATGMMLSAASATLYVRYLGHSPIFVNAIGRAVLASLAVSGAATFSAVTLGAVAKLTPTADPPASPAEGWIYADTDHHLYYHNGTSWLQLDNV